MRESKILKAICYICIPFLIASIFLSIIYEIEKNNYIHIHQEDSTYFNSDEFLNDYMNILSSEASCLIYENANYTNIQDENYTIYYSNSTGEYYRYYNLTSIKDFYYVIVYRSKIFTNVELTTETNTLEKLKQYISKNAENGKYANIVNSNIESNSEIISSKAIQYFTNFKNTYYTTTEQTQITEQSNPYIEITENNDSTLGNIEEKNESDIVGNTDKTYIYITTGIQDFQIFSSYKEELKENTSNKDVLYENLITNLKKYDSLVVTSIPICSIFLVLIGIYLIISIGYSRIKDTIDLNAIDKIPLEIILAIVTFVIIFGILALDELLISMSVQYYRLVISCSIAIYFVMYIITALSVSTIIKRIKAKTIFKDTIIGKIFKICVIIFKKIWEKCIAIFKKISMNWSVTLKIILVTVIYIVVAVILVALFGPFGAMVDCWIIGFILYKIIERVNEYQKIKKHLKLMYEGKHPEKLISKNFTAEFQDTINYINNISNGFESAMEERIKSERLKTELITNVSHDIKTPLTSIINYIDLLKKEEIPNEKAKEYLDVLENKSQRLKKLTEDLVEASKASSGNVKLEMQKIQLKELMNQSIGEFEDKFKEKGLEIITKYPKENISILADNRYLYRVIENVFGNISKYALENSRVYIDIEKKEKDVIISIKNISKERLNISVDELMQRFVRGDKSRTTEGSGLGLSISKSLTELQKGKFNIQVDGDLFKVELEFTTI